MKRSKKILIITLTGIATLILWMITLKNYSVDVLGILLVTIFSSLIISSVMIVKAHTNEKILDKKNYSNFAGGFIELFLYSLVMLGIWLIFMKENNLYQAILLTYPIVRFVAAFVDNKFYKFLNHFIFYRRKQEQMKANLQEESKKKALVRKRMNQAKKQMNKK